MPQQCPFWDLVTDHPLARAYLRAASISLLGCLSIWRVAVSVHSCVHHSLVLTEYHSTFAGVGEGGLCA
jgi:hypothetical protein